MKKYLKRALSLSAVTSTILISILGCSKDNDINSYQGNNHIVLKANSSQFIKNDGVDEILIDVLLVKTVNKDIELEFKLENNLIDGQEQLEIRDSKVVFKAGEKKAQLTIKSKAKATIGEKKDILLNLLRNNSQISLESPLTITLQPLQKFEQLTGEQIKLLDTYKSKGLNLYPLMGEVSLEGTVIYFGNGSLETMYNRKVSTIKGVSVFTLSEKATAEKPVLKMVSNAMGLESYLYTLFRQLTIEDKEYWNNEGQNAPPAPKKIMELIGLSPSSAESFQLSLDNIEIDLESKKISFIELSSYNNEINIVNFTYTYSAWERLKKLIEANNPIAIENSEQGGTVNPAEYLNTDNILEDVYPGNQSIWKASTAKLSDQSLSFDFLMGHSGAGNYITVSVKYVF